MKVKYAEHLGNHWHLQIENTLLKENDMQILGAKVEQ